MGVSTGLLDSIMHLLSGGLCKECKAEERAFEEQKRKAREIAKAEEQGRIEAHEENEDNANTFQSSSLLRATRGKPPRW